MNKFILQIFIFLCFGADSDLISQCNSTELLNIDKVVTNSRTGSSCNHTAQIDLLVNSKGNASACLVYTSGGAEKKICWNGGTTLSNHLVTFDADCNTSISLIAFPNPTGGGSPCSGPTAPTSFSTILPVEYVTFGATPQNDKVILEWSTASETNNEQFTIERSSDGMHFEFIGLNEGAGNSSELRFYNYIDEYANNGINYYRIKQTDYDGKFTYSDIRAVRLGKESEILVYPTITESFVLIESNEQDYDIQVLDQTGRQVYHISDVSGWHQIDLSEVCSGLYFVKVTYQGNIRTLRVVRN
jgi:hypothetical protein